MRIEKLWLPTVLSLLGISLLFPCGAQEVRASSAGKHCLWKIEGQSSTVYLLGSVHFLKKQNYPLPASIEAAFTNAQIAVFELDSDKMHDPAMQMKMLAKSRLPADESLKDQLSPETYLAFSNHVAKVGLSMEMLESLKPFAAVTILEMTELQNLGFEPEYGLDEYFSARARKEGKEVRALETVDFQIDLLTGFNKADGEAYLQAELKDIDNVQRDFTQMLEAWRDGDSTKLGKFLNDAMHESPLLFKRWVTDRNTNWIPKIEELTRGTKNAIVIVGAGHLIGTNGVVELLKKKGLKVSQE